MSTTLRYIPIPQPPPEMPISQGNITMVNNTLPASGVWVVGTSKEGLEQPSHEVIMLIALIIMLVTCTVLILLFMRSNPTYGSVHLKTFTKQYGEHLGRVNYRYSGLKLILRKIFLRLKERLNMGSDKTPREIASIDSRARSFAEIYEDIVYGDKERGDVSMVVEFVKKVFSIEE
ncbi:MAG: hypothetical protein QXP02_03330 [Desulfurococcaceae archaeon]